MGLLNLLLHFCDLDLDLLQLFLSAHNHLEVVPQLLPSMLLLQSEKGGKVEGGREREMRGEERRKD